MSNVFPKQLATSSNARSISVLVGVLAICGCSKSAKSTDGADAAPTIKSAPSAVHLPPPFSAVRLGMSRAELEAKFGPQEDLSKCEATLVGEEAPTPKEVPGDEKKPRARCARALEIGGITLGEVSRLFEKAEQVSPGGDSASAQEGLLMTYAQVRGSVRSGAVTEANLVEADGDKSSTAFDAVRHLADELFNGSVAFARARTARREVCALINDACNDVSSERVRTYVAGGYSLSQIDADAHSRVVNGKCRAPYLQNEKKLAMRLVSSAGGLSGIGLARASRSDRQISAADTSSFAVYSSRSKLEPKIAKFGVLVANGLPATESFWKGAVVLDPPRETKGTWLSAVIWFKDNRVVRALLNFADEKGLGELPKAVIALYGASGATRGAISTWTLADGTNVRLDIGAAAELVVESAATGSGRDGGAQP